MIRSTNRGSSSGTRADAGAWTRLAQHATGPPLGDVQLVADYGHRLPASRRAQKLPEVTSLRIALSRAWSATSFLSRLA